MIERKNPRSWLICSDSITMVALERMWPFCDSMLEQHGALELQFTNLKGSRAIKNAIYEHFGGRQITFHRTTYGTLHVVVSKEKIRTSSKPIATKPLSDFPEDLGKHKIAPTDFNAESEESRRCPVCGKWKLPSAFRIRHYKGELRQQSYCRGCQTAYDYWRYRILKRHNLQRLTPELTAGHGHTNSLFRQWYKEHYDNNGNFKGEPGC